MGKRKSHVVLASDRNPSMATSSIGAVYSSTPHKVKGYADNLTIIASAKNELQDVVYHANGWCRDICLHLRPDKCFTLLLVGGKAVNGVISVGGSKTSNIKDKPSKFLGASVSFSTSHTKRTTGSEFKKHFSTRLKSQNDAPELE